MSQSIGMVTFPNFAGDPGAPYGAPEGPDDNDIDISSNDDDEDNKNGSSMVTCSNFARVLL